MIYLPNYRTYCKRILYSPTDGLMDLYSARSLIQVIIVLDRHLTFRALRVMSLTTTVSDKTVGDVVNEIDKVSLPKSMNF